MPTTTGDPSGYRGKPPDFFMFAAMVASVCAKVWAAVRIGDRCREPHADHRDRIGTRVVAGQLQLLLSRLPRRLEQPVRVEHLPTGIVDLEVEVGRDRVAGGADVADDLAGGDEVALLQRGHEPAQVGVVVPVAAGSGEHERLAPERITAPVLRQHAVFHRHERRARGGHHVAPLVPVLLGRAAQPGVAERVDEAGRALDREDEARHPDVAVVAVGLELPAGRLVDQVGGVAVARGRSQLLVEPDGVVEVGPHGSAQIVARRRVAAGRGLDRLHHRVEHGHAHLEVGGVGRPEQLDRGIVAPGHERGHGLRDERLLRGLGLGQDAALLGPQRRRAGAGRRRRACWAVAKPCCATSRSWSASPFSPSANAMRDASGALRAGLKGPWGPKALPTSVSVPPAGRLPGRVVDVELEVDELDPGSVVDVDELDVGVVVEVVEVASVSVVEVSVGGVVSVVDVTSAAAATGPRPRRQAEADDDCRQRTERQQHQSRPTASGSTNHDPVPYAPDPMGAPPPELPPTMPVRGPGLARVAVDDEHVVFDAVHGRTHRLNRTAALVLDRCDGRTPTAAVCRDLHDQFGADLDEITHDLAEVLTDFARRQLVSTDSNEADGPVPPALDPEAAGERTALADEPVRTRRFVTGPLSALDVTAIVTTDDEALAAEMAMRLGSLASFASGAAAADAPPTTYELVAADRGVDVRADGRTIGNARGADAALALVQWHLNRLVAARASQRLQLHASAVRLPDGRVAVFPGEANAGKSTLVAGLVRAGYGYLTDETVAVELGTGRAEGYRKLVNLDPGSWALFPGVVPNDAAARGDEHLVDPQALHADALAGPSDGEVALIAFPAYRCRRARRAPPPSHRPPRSSVSIAHCTNLAPHGQDGLDTLAGLVGRAPAYELDMGGLDEAVREVDALVAGLPGPA